MKVPRGASRALATTVRGAFLTENSLCDGIYREIFPTRSRFDVSHYDRTPFYFQRLPLAVSSRLFHHLIHSGIPSFNLDPLEMDSQLLHGREGENNPLPYLFSFLPLEEGEGEGEGRVGRAMIPGMESALNKVRIPSAFTNTQWIREAKLALASKTEPVDHVELVDSEGIANPSKIRRVCSALQREGFSLDRASFFFDSHASSPLNLETALECGIRNFTASVNGYGRRTAQWSENWTFNPAKTEELVPSLQQVGVETGVDANAVKEASYFLEHVLGKDHPIPKPLPQHRIPQEKMTQ